MIDIYRENGIDISGETYEKLCAFSEFLREYNRKVNLTSITEDRDIHIKHFYDSIKGEKFFKKNAFVVEIGSGGGFPSVPLMLYREDLNFVLVEATGKKCAFLKEVVDKFNLRATVINARAEDLAKDARYREKFDVCCARAVARLNTLCEYCLPFVKKGGIFAAYKGDAEEEVLQAENALKILGGRIVSEERYELPQNEGCRTVVAVEKVEKTPEKYPRGRGKERSSPL